MILSRGQIRQDCIDAGLRGLPLATAVAISLAESNGDTAAHAWNPPTPQVPTGSWDDGNFQINDHYHAEVPRAEAHDRKAAARHAARISKAGKDWHEWATWPTAYLAHFDIKDERMSIAIDSVIASARSQVGTKETGLNNTPYGRALDAAGIDVHDDGSPYPLGRAGAEWCGTFCRWLLWIHNIPVPQGLYLYTVANDADWCRRHGCLIPATGAAQPGDLVMYYGPQFPGWHIGIVIGVWPDGRIQTVEGNVSNQVGEYTRDRSQVQGFYRPAYPLDPPVPPIPPTPPLPGEDMPGHIVCERGHEKVDDPVYAITAYGNFHILPDGYADLIRLGIMPDIPYLNPDLQTINNQIERVDRAVLVSLGCVPA